MTRSRREFLKASAAVAAGGLVATRSASALSPSGSLITAPGLLSSDLPSANDPAIKALMQAALDVAKTGGASYADVRVAARRQQNVNTRDRIVQGVSDTDTFGLGVRTLVDGAWGFAATSRLDKDSVANATRAALEQARANRASQLRPVQLAERRWQVDGTPTDCVMLACEALLEARPDYVISGINHGPNMGEDVLYSGTVAAAMEGLALGIPSIAVSFAGSVLRADALLETQVEVLRDLLKHLMSLSSLPRETLLNVNLPNVAGDQIKGVRLTRLGRRVFSDSITKMKDPWGREILWIGGGSVTWSGPDDSDFRAVHDGYISVTPLHLDLTHRDVLDTATDWWRPL
mgnify:CR=1 FL=1